VVFYIVWNKVIKLSYIWVFSFTKVSSSILLFDYFVRIMTRTLHVNLITFLNLSSTDITIGHINLINSYTF